MPHGVSLVPNDLTTEIFCPFLDCEWFILTGPTRYFGGGTRGRYRNFGEALTEALKFFPLLAQELVQIQCAPTGEILLQSYGRTDIPGP